MSEEATKESVITITISENSVKYDTDLAMPEVVFWVEMVKAMVVDRILNGEPV